MGGKRTQEARFPEVAHRKVLDMLAQVGECEELVGNLADGKGAYGLVARNRVLEQAPQALCAPGLVVLYEGAEAQQADLADLLLLVVT